MTDRQMLRLIGENVKRARLKAELTQECVAELAGIHWQTVSNIENGKFPVLMTTFVRIGQALETSADDLLNGIPEPDAKRTERIKRAMARKRRPRS